MFERFDEQARRVVVLAQEEARLLQHASTGTEHLLLAVVHDVDGAEAKTFAALGLSAELVRSEIRQAVPPGSSSPDGHIPFTPGAKRAFEEALRECLASGPEDGLLGPEHILLGLARGSEGVAAQVLKRLGADVDRLRAQLSSGADGATAVVMTRRTAMAPVFMTGRGAEQCSFCGRDLWEVERHVASASARICDGCVDACAGVIEVAETQDAPAYEPLRLPARIFGSPPDDATAVDDVTRAVQMAFGGGGGGGGARDDQERATFIEDGGVLAPLLSMARARFPQAGGAAVRAVRFVDGERAQVRFAIQHGASELPFTGEVMLRDGAWRVSRDTVENLLASAGVVFPPRT